MLVDCFVKLCISICYTALDVYSTSLCLFRPIPNTLFLCGVEWECLLTISYRSSLHTNLWILIDSFIVEISILNRRETHHCYLPVRMVTLPLWMFFSDVEQTPT